MLRSPVVGVFVMLIWLFMVEAPGFPSIALYCDYDDQTLPKTLRHRCVTWIRLRPLVFAECALLGSFVTSEGSLDFY